MTKSSRLTKRSGALANLVLRMMQKHAPSRDQEPIVVGVSGGPDSVCLLHVLCRLRDRLGIKLHVAHLNHLLRGAESDADARYVSWLAQSLGVPATIGRRDVKGHRAQHRLSLEEAARGLRYDFFAEVADSIGAGCVAVGHTADDQIETILMHLVRGTGLAGLRGMQPVNTWRSSRSGVGLTVLRPLLEVSREETEAYCAAHGLSPRTDSSNESLTYLRNQLRWELIPLLRSYNPNIGAALLRTARAAADELALLEERVSELWPTVVKEQPNGVVLDTEAFATLPPALKRHLLRAVLERLLGDGAEIESVHVEDMMEALKKPAGKKLSLPRGLALSLGYGVCTVGWQDSMMCPLPPLEGEHPLNIPGETTLPGWRVRGSILEGQRGESSLPEWTSCFDLDATGTSLVVRGRRPGDRFRPLGMGHPKKLQDFMVDAKIPRWWRSRVPLVCSPQHILWVVGWRIDERAKVSDSTKRVLRLEFERAYPSG